MEYQWYSQFEEVGYPLDILKQQLVILVGPSGAGKTEVANYLCQADPSYMVLRNYTTRAQRPTDHLNHFDYLSDNQYFYAQHNHEFFLARLAPPPRYGYKLKDLRYGINNGKRLVLMFRHSGIRYLCELSVCIPTIFIEGDPGIIACHSRNKVSPPTKYAVQQTISANRKMYDFMVGANWPCLRIVNHYAGEAELLSIAKDVKVFISNGN